MQAEFLYALGRRTVTDLADGLEAAVPLVVQALVFLAVAYVGIKLVLAVLRRVLDRLLTDRESLVVQLCVTVVGVFLWFAVGLATLKILGLGEIAASLGTSVGFIALGVSYALSNMIEDTVAGVYLLNDPDFEVGDEVAAADTEGTIRAIELRKTRLERANGDTTVLANRDVEAEWTKRAD